MLPTTMGSLIRPGERQTRHTTLCVPQACKKKKKKSNNAGSVRSPAFLSPTPPMQHDCTVLERRSQVRPVHKKTGCDGMSSNVFNTSAACGFLTSLT